jgi:class 3 adenylate cyclase
MFRVERETSVRVMVSDGLRGLGRPLLVERGVSEAEVRAFSLPIGTVSFLMTDVESSTRRWEVAPEAMAVAVSRHYALLEREIARHNGVRPVEQGEGDSVVGAFSRASDAVATALSAQLAFAAESWPAGADLRVRMAVHTGEAQLRDDGNYVGHTLNRCARIRSIAHGGQVLTQGCREAAEVVIGPARHQVEVDGLVMRAVGLGAEAANDDVLNAVGAQDSNDPRWVEGGDRQPPRSSTARRRASIPSRWAITLVGASSGEPPSPLCTSTSAGGHMSATIADIELGDRRDLLEHATSVPAAETYLLETWRPRSAIARG